MNHMWTSHFVWSKFSLLPFFHHSLFVVSILKCLFFFFELFVYVLWIFDKTKMAAFLQAVNS